MGDSKFLKGSHCSFCGARFDDGAAWPRRCARCANLSYRNPIPVAVLIQPVDDGVLVMRRGVAPRIGELALPGGFVDFGESWQAAAARELYEETNVRIAPEDVTLFDVRSAADGTLLVFGKARPLVSKTLSPFIVNAECPERLVITSPIELAFPLHTAALKQYFSKS